MKEIELAARDTPVTTPPAPNAQPATGPSSTGGSFIMNAINTGIALVKNPVAFMESHKDTPMTENEIMVNYIAVLAAIPLVATLIGDLWYYRNVGFSFSDAILLYIFDIAAVYILGIVIRSLAKSFSSSPDPVRALKLAAYAYTPAFLIAVIFIIPPLAIIGFLGLLYGLYILYLGLPIMMGTPKDKVIPYLIVTIVAVFVIYFIFALIVGRIELALFHVII
jgi:Yip1 domain